MPWRPPSPCSWPGCPAVSARRFCREHEQAEHRRYAEERKALGANRVYGTRWRKVRAVVLAREPLCRLCSAEGHPRLATEVDHIVPWRVGGARYDLANLRPLCRQHHARVTAQERTHAT